MNQPVRFTDETFRDGQQSIIATRMKTEDMKAIAPEMDKVGFYCSEIAGGATFDVAIRYLNEDPWERIRILRELMPNTKLQMHFRGQNLVGYRQYPDDVVKAFVRYASNLGIDIFRMFDALDDERNLSTCINAVKECGKEVQIQLQYSLTELKLGGPIYNIDYYVNKARIVEDMGADSISIADTCGMPSPEDAYNLIKALKKAVKIPVGLHCHNNSGMAPMAYYKAIEAGVDIIDTASGPFALRSSFPATETMAFALQGTSRDPGFDIPRLVKISNYFEKIAPKYKEFMTNKISLVDINSLVYQIPGGMLTNLLFQLKQLNAEDKFEEACNEIPRVRKELGYPPLATPASQMIIAQSVQNVLLGSRYKMVSRQIKDYVYGLYGKPPHPIDPDIQKMILENYEKGNIPISCRPADLLEPELDSAKEATKGIARDIGDVLIYAIDPINGMRFLKQKYNLNN